MNMDKALSGLREGYKEPEEKGEKKEPKKKTTRVELGKKGSFTVRKGALHRALEVPEGQKLGQARIDAALHSKNPETRREAASAKGLTHMKH